MTDKKNSSGEEPRRLPDARLLFAIIALLAVAVVTLTVLLFQDQEDEEEVAALVNGKPIMKEELFDTMYILYGKDTLDQLITRKLIFEAAEEAGLTVEEAELEEEIDSIIEESFEGSEEDFKIVLGYYGLDLDTFREDARLNMLVRRLARKEMDLTEDDARDYFESNRHLFEQQEEVEVRQIVVESAEEAEEILDFLAQGNDFEEVAAEYSIDFGSRGQGGHLGFLGRGVMPPEFDEVAFDMDIGEISEPIETVSGFHIIELLDRREEETVTFDEVSEEAMDSMTESFMGDVIQMLVQKLFIDADIEYLLEDEMDVPEMMPDLDLELEEAPGN